jgi:hypothetical protein
MGGCTGNWNYINVFVAYSPAQQTPGRNKQISDCLHGAQIQFLNFFSSPRSSSQKLQAGFDAWVVRKAFDRNPPAQFFPAELFHQMSEDKFKGDAM